MINEGTIYCFAKLFLIFWEGRIEHLSSHANTLDSTFRSSQSFP